jgi:RNA polymerase sigma-70 factor (ECF subfamily)
MIETKGACVSERQKEKTLEEAKLVTEAQKGDGEAFSALIGPHIRQAYHIALRITSNHEDAEDATQQALFKAFERVQQFKSQSRFSSWLFRITINEALMKIRKLRTKQWVPFDEMVATEFATSASHPEAIYAQEETRQFLQDAIDSLKGASRAIVWVRGLYERDTKETAEILNMSTAVVKTRFWRARQQLRKRLANRYEAIQARPDWKSCAMAESESSS